MAEIMTSSMSQPRPAEDAVAHYTILGVWLQAQIIQTPMLKPLTVNGP